MICHLWPTGPGWQIIGTRSHRTRDVWPRALRGAWARMENARVTTVRYLHRERAGQVRAMARESGALVTQRPSGRGQLGTTDLKCTWVAPALPDNVKAQRAFVAKLNETFDVLYGAEYLTLRGKEVG